MKLNSTAALLLLGLTPACLSQESKHLPPECTKTIRVHGSVPTGPFKTAPGEAYRASPLVKFEIKEGGTVSNVKMVRSSGLADVDKKILNAVAHWKYKARPTGCGVTESEMSVLIHLY